MVQPQSSAVQIPPGGNQFLYGVQPVVQRQSLDSSGGSSDFMTGWGNSNLSAGTNVTRYSTSSGSNPASQNSSAGWNQDPSSAGTRVSQVYQNIRIRFFSVPPRRLGKNF